MKEVMFLDPKKLSAIRVPDFLKDYFLENKYHLLSKNQKIKNFSLFINLKILRKFRLLFLLIKKVKFNFFSPNNSKIIIFDDLSLEVLEKLISEKKFFTIATRLQNIKEIYISFKIISYIVKNLFMYSLKINYICALISIIKPSKIITIIDNSVEFHIVSNIFKDKGINFYAFQNAYRHEKYLKQILHSYNYSGHYLTFSDYEMNCVKKAVPKLMTKSRSFGSLRIEIAKEYLKKKGLIQNNIKMYDICLISEATFQIGSGTSFKTNLIDSGAVEKSAYLFSYEKITKLVRYLIDFCDKHQKKLLILGRAQIGSNDSNLEKIYYKSILKDKSFKIKFFDKSKYENIRYLLQSDLVVGTHSTLLRESFGLNKKILVCDWMKESRDDIYFPGEGIFKLSSEDYQDFEKKISDLLNLDYSNYITKVKNLNYIYNSKSDSLDKIRKEL